MKRRGLGAQFAVKFAFPTGIAAVLVVCLAVPSRGDRKSEAAEQFAHAVRMRTTLEGFLEKDRALADYKQTIAAYQKVYLISVNADEVTPAIVAQAELYEEMGRLFDPKYFKSSISSYKFLIQQYPGSRYRGSAMLAIARIQKQDLADLDAAEASYKDYLKFFPRSENSSEARSGLKEIAARRARGQAQVAAQARVAAGSTQLTTAQVGEPMADQPPAETGPRIAPRADDQKVALVKDIRTWNSQDSTRIVVTLNDTIRFDAARIASPDRIYFDISKARLAPTLSKKPIDVQGGLLKSVRIAPNKPGVVRVVLDVDGAKDYSAFLLGDPYRLVIDVHAQGVNRAKSGAPQTPTAAVGVAANPVKRSDTVASDAERPVAAHETVAVSTSASNGPASAVDASPSKPSSLATAAPKSSTLKRDSGGAKSVATLTPPAEPKPMRDGDRSLTRVLGLKISRIAIDPGHGGHDTGTIGPHGLMEKDLCLDVALRLGALIQQKLPSAQVVYTRQDDTFIPLEDRTKIANEAKADLFISIHANSSPNAAARGVETYYLNFATSPESMEVAARENANSQESLHDLQDIIQKIARNEKIEESKEFATDVQGALSQRLQLVSMNERNRGVKKAPFIVLIGANMPSVLAEISFVSNPHDERLLRKPQQRQRIADGLYRGVVVYLTNMNSLMNNKQKLVSDNHPSDTRLDVGEVASAGNSK
jgi:N-acetylmuramoyl-L-alanine amidase